jgi:uncharacterized membrane protein YbaN (DUF454 family)
MRIRTAFLTIAGCVCFAIGAVGAVLPLLPSTPFILVACACFAGVPKLRNGVMKIPFVRVHLENYQTRKGLPRKTVIGTLAFLWGSLCLWAVILRKPWMILLFAAVGVCVSVHILCVARAKPREEE